jgi:glucokinase
MEKQYAFGVDVGGTSVKLGLFDRQGKLLEKWSIPSRKEAGAAGMLQDIEQTLRECVQRRHLRWEQICGIGVGVPGPVVQGTVLHCVNLDWDRVEVSKILRDALRVPVCCGNDANVAALGECWQGAGKGCDSLVMVTLGTGVGGGVVVGGKMLEGRQGAAGEIGHMPVYTGGTHLCGCGKGDCLERVASAPGLVRLTRRLLSEEGQTTLSGEADFTAQQVWEAAEKENAVALRAVEEMCRFLGQALAQVACVLAPQRILLGGGMSRAGEALRSRVERYYRTMVFPVSADIPILLATLDNDAGIYGAAGMILREEANNGN